MSTTITLTDAQLNIVAALASTKQKIAELGDVVEHLKAQLIAELGDAEEAVNADGATVIRYKASRRFDATKAASFFTDEQLAAAHKTTVDAAKLKKMLTGDQLDACMVPGTSRTFTVVDA